MRRSLKFEYFKSRYIFISILNIDLESFFMEKKVLAL